MVRKLFTKINKKTQNFKTMFGNIEKRKQAAFEDIRNNNND